jgi:hypothetical protein
MVKLHTLAKRVSFEYDGSMETGFHITMGEKSRATVTAETLARLMTHFREQPAPVEVGASRTNPPAGSLGAWLIANHPGAQVASYLAAILVAEKQAVVSGKKLAFPRRLG